METFHRVITMSRWAGIAPVTRKNIDKNTKGDDYAISKRAMIFYVIQIITLFWMVDQFNKYIERKKYYSKVKALQVSVLMYCEVLQCIVLMICSIFLRFPNLEALLRECKSVIIDMANADVPLPVKYFGVIEVLWNTLFAIYRTKNSLNRKKLMFPFWLGMNQIILLKSLLLVLLSIVATSYKKINKDLYKILAKPSRNAKRLQLVVYQLNRKQQRASNLMGLIFKDFGPDLLFMCLFFIFKIMFVVYHVIVTLEENMWGHNTLLGELTGYIQILQLLVNVYSLAYVTDSLFERKKETHILLLTLMKSVPTTWSPELINTIKTFILQVKSHPDGFNVCSHFNFTRALVYEMLWGALTYVFVLIQF